MKILPLMVHIGWPLGAIFSASGVAQALSRANTSPLAPQYEIHQDASVSLRVCFNSFCAGQRIMSFSPDEMKVVRAQIQSCVTDSETNRGSSAVQRLRIDVWQMELLAQKYYPPLANDLAVNDQEFGVEGRTDWVDKATNTTSFLKILIELGLLKAWTVAEPVVRKPRDINRVHWTAVATDASNKKWSADSWFRRHGHLPFVVPLGDWQREQLAWEGQHERFNPYPRSIVDLCE